MGRLILLSDILAIHAVVLLGGGDVVSLSLGVLGIVSLFRLVCLVVETVEIFSRRILDQPSILDSKENTFCI